MKSNKKRFLIALIVISMVTISACDVMLADTSGGSSETLQASGVVEAIEVVVAPELGGRIAEVFVDEGDEVKTGEVLFRLEEDILNAQRKQASAAYDAAEANLEAANAALNSAQSALKAAQASVETAQLQYKIALNEARSQEQPERVAAWNADVPDEFDLPAWYFDKPEEIEAAEAELAAAQEALNIEQANYDKVIQDASNADLREAETRLAGARAAFLVAEDLTNRDIDQQEGKQIGDFAQTLYDAAKAELDAAQLAYDQILSNQSAMDVLEARARVSVAKERYEIALDRLNALFTGEDDLTVQAAATIVTQAQAGVEQAEAGVAQAEVGLVQAEKAVAQAKATLDMADIQIEMLTIRAAVPGVIMTRSIEPGEVIQPGLAAMTIGQLDKLTVTVYIPEDKYGHIKVGDIAQLTVDSFPNETFEGTVTRIADRAEYTPRNVQTKEDRQTTVYAIELSVNDPDGKLKPGMPTDVTFNK